MTLLCLYVDMCTVHKIVSHLTSTFPIEVKQGDALPSYFSSPTVNKYPFPVYLVSHCSHFCFVGDFVV